MVIKKRKKKHILIAVCTTVSCADSSDYERGARGARVALLGWGWPVFVPQQDYRY